MTQMPLRESRFLENDWYDQPLPLNVTIGEGSSLYSTYAFRHFHSVRNQGLSIGNHSGLYVGTMFDVGPGGEVSIGNYCSIVGAVFCTNHRIIIHDYVFIAHEVVLADSAYASPVVGQGGRADHLPHPAPATIEIHSNAWIGMRAVLLAGARIGEGAIVGAAAVVDFDVPDYSIVAGSPGKIVGSVK